MGNKHHHKVSSFNPAWCLRPPPNNSNTGSHHVNMSPVPSAYHPNKKCHYRRRGPHQSPTPQAAVEPTSPRVGCMGQIRRCKSQSSTKGSVKSKSTSSPPPSSSSSSGFSYEKCTNGSATSISSSPADIAGNRLLMLKRVNSRRVSVEEMDPPRPVEKKVVRGLECSVSLWERRCRRGDGLRLELQPLEQSCV